MKTELKKQISRVDDLLKKELFEKAEEICTELLLSEPDNIDILLKITEIQIRTNDDSQDQAYATILKALSISENNPIALAYLSRIYRIQGKNEDAKKTIESAIAQDPTCAISWAIKGSIAADIDQNFEEAFQFFNRALSFDSEDYRIWFWYGWRQWDAGYLEKSIESFKKADQLNPNDANILYFLSEAQYSAGKYEDSIKSSKRYLLANPNNIDAIKRLGISYGKIQDYENAIEVLSPIKDQLEEVDLFEWGIILHDNQKFDDALKVFKNIFSKNEKDVSSCNWIGSCYYAQKNLEQALSFYQKVLTIDPEYSHAHHNIYLVLLDMKKGDEAKDYLIQNQLPIISSPLIQTPEVGSNWQWLDSRPASKKEGNKFLLACSVDGQQPALKAWEKVKVFAEETLGDPENLWEEIINLHSEEQWKSRDCKNIYKLHPFDSWHFRIYDIAQRIVKDLNGDARKIWRKGDPNKPLGIEDEYESDVILDRLDYYMFGSPKYDEHQIPRMVLGALLDSEQALGPADPKADTHVIRVVGRVVYGIEDLKDQLGDQKAAENVALHTARLISPENPWYVDQQLFAPGALYKICVHSTPKCDKCGYNHFCFYKLGLKKELPNLPEKLPSLKEFQKERGIIST